MRSILFCAGLVLLWGGPAAAGPLSACDFITQAEVENMLGEKVGPPNVIDGGLCAGSCESVNGSICDFVSADTAQQDFFLQILLPPYEFSHPAESVRMAWKSDIGDFPELVEDIPGLGKAAIWYYRADNQQSLLYVLRDSRVHLIVGQFGVEPHAALANALATAKLALNRFGALKKSRLRNAFQFELPGDIHPWRP